MQAEAVLAPVETLYRFSPDRSRGQSIIVRKNSDGTYSAVTDPDDLANHEAESTESDESGEETAITDSSDEDELSPTPGADEPSSVSVPWQPIIVQTPGVDEHPADAAANRIYGLTVLLELTL